MSNVFPNTKGVKYYTRDYYIKCGRKNIEGMYYER